MELECIDTVLEGHVEKGTELSGGQISKSGSQVLLSRLNTE